MPIYKHCSILSSYISTNISVKSTASKSTVNNFYSIANW